MKITPLGKIRLEANYNRIIEALKKTGYHQGKAAKLLGIDPKTIYNTLKRYESLAGAGETEKAS